MDKNKRGAVQSDHTDGMIMGNKTVNACMPGFGASCALCCGSHNCDAAPDEMAGVYRRRREIISLYSRDYLVKRVMASRSDMTGSYYFTGRKDVDLPGLPSLFGEKRCPFIGFYETGDLIGCLLNRGAESSLRYECFNNYSSKNFICAAKENLGGDEIVFAAKLCRDWFYYPLLIHRPGILARLMRDWGQPEAVPEEVLEKTKVYLRSEVRQDASLHRMLSYF